MSNIRHMEFNKNPKTVGVDILVCYLIQPPALIPLSERAKKVLALPEGVESVIFPVDTAEEVMGLFEEDYVLGLNDTHVPKNIVTRNI